MRTLTLGLLIALATPAAAQEGVFGEELFNAFCAACHGETGAGDGPLADRLLVAPADLTTLSAQNDGVYPVVRVVRQIDGRDPALAHSGVMPLFGEYFEFQDAAIGSEFGQPILTSAPIAELVLYLEGLQQ